MTKANDALLDEMRWIHQRKQEAKRFDVQLRLATRRARARRVAIARTARTRSLFAKLGESARRCTCYDFDCWEPLWQMDAVLAMDLRARGFHFYDCVLAPYNPARGILWNIKKPFREVEPRGTLILANPNGMAEEYDEKHEADSTISSLEHGESGSESGNEASDRDAANEDANVQGV